MKLLAILLCGTLVIAGCGGGAVAPPEDGTSPGDDTPAGSQFQTTVHESTASSFRASVAFAPAKITMTEDEGTAFAKVECEGCRSEAPGDGAPGIPMLTRVLLVPQGAEVEISDVVPVVGTVHDLLVRPYQAQAGDDSPEYEQPGPISDEAHLWTPPFVHDMDAYASDAPQPPEPVRASPVQSARNVSAVILRVAAGMYEAASRRLTLYSRIDFTVRFVGGSDVFLDPDAGNPFVRSSASLVRMAWNGEAVESETPLAVGEYIEYGEELIILTHPSYRVAADRLARHKNGLGLLTRVFTVNDGPSEPGPDTHDEIKTFLDARHANTLVHASYLLLMGDHFSIPPWNLPTRYHKSGHALVPTDFPYAQINKDPYGDDLFPDVSLGRISVSSATEATSVVDKIIQYESDPPAGTAENPFYKRAALATSFHPSTRDEPPCVEWHRNLIPRAERAIKGLVARGYEVQRLYSAKADQSIAENIPCRLASGSELPFPLRQSDGFTWDAHRDAVISAFDTGNSLICYTGHGGHSKWCEPRFTTDDLRALNNGALLPFVVNASCATGGFGGFAERIVRMPDGGAIGSVGFTRNANSAFTRTLLWSVAEQDCLPPNGAPRLGDLVDCARARMAALADSDVSSELFGRAHTHTRMLQLHGDPTIRLWERAPVTLPAQGIDTSVGVAIEFDYAFPDATITAVEDLGELFVPIGRSPVRDGRVSIDPIVPPSGANPIRYFAVHGDGVAREISVVRPE